MTHDPRRPDDRPHCRDEADEHTRLTMDPVGRLEWWRTIDILSPTCRPHP